MELTWPTSLFCRGLGDRVSCTGKPDGKGPTRGADVSSLPTGISLNSSTGSQRWIAQFAPLRNPRSSSHIASHAFWLHPQAEAFPVAAASFANPPPIKFRFPSLVIASANDPYGTIEYARERASEWGSGIVEVGELGHLNEASGLEDWPQGKALLTAFVAGIAN